MPDATERATAAVTVLGGLIYTRYLNPLPSSTRMTAAEIRRTVAPALHAALQPRIRRSLRRPPVAAPATSVDVRRGRA